MEITPITSKYFFEVNSYLIKTQNGFILIDAGFKKRRAQLEKALEEAGCVHGDLKLIVLTHGHSDHLGNVAYIRDKYGSKVAAHRDEERMIESGNMFIDAENSLVVSIVGGLMKLFGLSDFERFTPDIYLEDGQNLSEYGFPATVIHTPGHSKGSISLLTEDGDLFCGDIYGNDKKPEKTTIIQDQVTFDESVERIRSLEVHMFYPGHGTPFSTSQLEI